MPSLVIVKAAFDPEAGVWYVESSDLPGLNVEAASVEELRAKMPAAVEDLLAESSEGAGIDVPIEIIAHASTGAQGRAVPASFGMVAAITTSGAVRAPPCPSPCR